MGLRDIFKKQLSATFKETLPENLKISVTKATETFKEPSFKTQEKAIYTAHTAYTLPRDIEQDILNGLSYSKCKKKLKAKRGFDTLDSKELDRMIRNAGSRIFNERLARQFEKDCRYYKIQHHSGSPCSICLEKSKQLFEFKNRKLGDNFPPLHDGCECTIQVVIPDRNKWMEDYENRYKK